MQQSYAERYASFEENHWWFRARRVILRELLQKGVEWRPGMQVFEIGVGPGLNLYSLYPSGCEIRGLEPDVENAGVANRRGPIPVSVGTIESMPSELLDRCYDVITMFDVLEHIKDDIVALERVKSLLVPGGYFILTVPAYQWLWSQHDEVNLHFRRYTRTQILECLKNAGLSVQRATYFNTLLLPTVAAARLAQRLIPPREKESCDFDRSSGGLDKLFFRIFAAERNWLRRYSFPAGVSVFAIARKPSNGV